MQFDLNHPCVRLHGRTYQKPDTPGHVCIPWTCGGFSLTFRGDSLQADMGSDAWHNENACPYLTIILDGDDQNRSTLAVNREGMARYTLASGLGEGQHTVTVLKMSEALQSGWEVASLYLPDGGGLLDLLPEKARPKIEFIGDSITAGFGNRCPTKDGPFTTREQDGYDSYGAIAARALGADYQIFAVSGYGVYRSPFGKDVPPLYPYVDGLHGVDIPWDFSVFRPDVVVVNLGTNDGGWINLEPSLPTEEKIRLVIERYVEFLHTIRRTHPQAYILSTIGLLESNATPYVKQAVARARAEGMDRLSFFELPAAESFGAGHPSLKAHQKAAVALEKELSSLLG